MQMSSLIIKAPEYLDTALFLFLATNILTSEITTFD